MHGENSFVTLTYAESSLPPGGSLCLRDFQLFLKRLRRSAAPARVRFFHCGEYGEKFLRPHYHALLFGYDFADKAEWAVRSSGPVWRSELLEELWPHGQSEIGSVTFESAAYVARYVCKKVTGDAAAEHYTRLDSGTGELVQVEPEYATMSRKPGLGRAWIEKFSRDVYPSDEVVVRGFSSKPGRYYDEFWKAKDAEGFEAIKRKRAKARRREDETPARLSVREVCATARAALFKRRLEEC